jgi:hypothetical protein
MTGRIQEPPSTFFRRARRPGKLGAGGVAFSPRGADDRPVKTVQAFERASLLDGAPIGQARLTFKNFDEEAAFLRKIVDQFTGNAALREITLRVVFPLCRPKDEPAQALAIGRWVQDRTYYVHECDDYAIAIASMLGCVGIRNKLCILKINGRWAHIFPVALVNDGGRLHRLTLDGTLLKRSDDGDHEPIDDPIGDYVNPIALVQARGDQVEAFFV